MTFGWRRPVFWAMGAAMVCLVGAASVRGQAGPAQGTLMTDTHFQDVQVLKGIPVDTFFDVMGMFAASMGDDCTYCHVKDSVTNRDSFAVETERIVRARQMIMMMNTINRSFFAGEERVTCFTCHRGAYTPAAAPRLALQYGVPDDEPNNMNFLPDPNASAEPILDRYLEALGGTERLSQITSFIATGTYSGFDTGFGEVPVEIFAKAPNQRTWIIQMVDGPSRRVFDGTRGWWAGVDTPAPLVPQTSGNLDRARLEALVAFPAGIKDAFPEWRVGQAIIDDRDVQIAQGVSPDLLPVNFYFDNETDLLVRIVRWNDTPVGPVPTEIDYGDYREVAGVLLPFTWTVTQTYMQMTIALSDVQPNVPIDAAVFDQPEPVTPQ